MQKKDWPSDADGDVLRRLDAMGFDFSKTHTIDFNVDFDEWPPSKKALAVLITEFPRATIYEDEDESDGYVLFKIIDKVSHELVIKIQDRASELVAAYGGRCESWGVLHG